MEPEVVGALIAGIVALGTSLLTVYQQRRLARHQAALADRQQQSSRELAERQREAAENLERLRGQLETQRDDQRRERDALEQLNLHREPLLDAAADLFHRIRNIREQGFLGYLNSTNEHRRQMTTLGTLYRFGKYLGTVDNLYGTVTLLQLQLNPATQDVADLLTRVGTAFADDSRDGGGRTLMFWREEQRAVAELMQRGATGGKPVIGFATFVQRYSAEFAPWFTAFELELRPGIETSPRLAALQSSSHKLVAQLDRSRR